MNGAVSKKNEARGYEDDFIEDEEQTDASTRFLRIQKNQLIDLKICKKGYTNTVSVFAFNSGRFDINLNKSYLIPYLTNKKKLNLQLSRNQKTFFRSNMDTFSFWTLWNFWGELLFRLSLRA